MAYCSKCGKEVLDGSNFCSNCGQQINDNLTIKRKTIFEGELHKCPNCGEILDSFMLNCPACGYEIRNLKTNSSVEKLMEKIKEAKSLDEKNEIITNFYIPNTKEDIFDFLILAISNLEDKNYDTDDAWNAKLEQVYHKAKITFRSSPELDYIESIYAKTKQKVMKREYNITTLFRRNKTAWIVTSSVIGIIVIIIFTITFLLNSNSKDERSFIYFILLISAFILLAVISLTLEEYETEKRRRNRSINNKTKTKAKSKLKQKIGKGVSDFVGHNYEDAVKFLKKHNFKNIVVKPKKRGMLDNEGDIESISVAGNKEFSKDDEFNINSKIIIYYFSSITRVE